MRREIRISALVAIVSLACAAISSASTLTVTLDITARANAAGAIQTTNAQAAADAAAGIPGLYRVDLNSLITNLAAGQIFFNQSADFALSGGITRIPASVGSARPDYVGNNPPSGVFDSAGTSLNTFFTNSDLGSNGHDLLGVAATLDGNTLGHPFTVDGDPAPSDPRTTIAQGTKFKIGSVWVNFAGAVNGTLSVTQQQYSTATANGTGGYTADLASPFTVGPSANFIAAAVPEPASIVLMGLGGLGLAFVARRRRSA